MVESDPKNVPLDTPRPLAVPPVSILRQEGALSGINIGRMERTISEDIREEREDLKEAAEFTHSVVVELSLDGIIRWVSPSWLDVVGTTVEDVLGRPITALLVTDASVFERATDAIRKDDTRSQNIRFTVTPGPSSILRRKHSRRKEEAVNDDSLNIEEPQEELTLDLEGQGIMVFNRTTGQESHVGLYGLFYYA
jgi:serine/threonine-protein kinase RIM15